MTMEISNIKSNTTFQSKIVSSKAVKEVSEYAKTRGINNIIDRVNSRIELEDNLKLNIKHHYSKPYDTTKTEITYKRNGRKCKYVEMSGTIKNPSELTLNILLNLKNSTSKVFKEIFG